MTSDDSGVSTAIRQNVLEIDDLSKSFGGLAAVQHLTFAAEAGRITSMIGPNGAGKSTVFNLISGLYKPDGGQILFEGRPIAGLSPDRVQKQGVARTFQNQRLFANLSVLENVLIGYHSRLKAGLFGDIVKPPWTRREEADARERAMEVLRLFGRRLAPNAHRRCLDLPYADRRLLELARAIVSRPRLLMLDEPTAGMNPTETVDFMDYVRNIQAMGMSILLIEHNLSVVMGISEHVVVLDYGTKIAEGTAQEVRQNERVIEAYLGRRATSA
ncbi:MAG TPA: ABC transporter ATP-binding protein [Chloroflexota bacterium]|nr:ABC transporter ATP-binding protein [Chloroflexota bacterium]